MTALLRAIDDRDGLLEAVFVAGDEAQQAVARRLGVSFHAAAVVLSMPLGKVTQQYRQELMQEVQGGTGPQD